MEHPRDSAHESVFRSSESAPWPSVPAHLPDKPLPPYDITLPDLRTVLSPDFYQHSPPDTTGSLVSPLHRHASPTSVRSLPPIDPSHSNSNAMDTSMTSPVDTASVISADDGRVRSTSVSMDNPKERIAAEMLSELAGGNSDFSRPSRGQQPVHMTSHASPKTPARASDAEPLLELVSQAHPWVGGTIKGSLSAYSTTKYYSPRIVQYGVNFVERNVGTPFVNVVGSVSTMTGVEAGLRRHLDARRAGDLEHGGEKMGSAMEVDFPDRLRRGQGLEAEQLPPYPTSRPPSYREEASPDSTERQTTLPSRERPSATRSWSSQLIVSTSGLSIALSKTSRQSLRFCLQLLANQSGNVSQLTRALSLALSNYEQTRQRYHRDNDSMEKGERPPTPDQDEHARRLAIEIRHHCDNIWQALRHTVNVVSNYAGGALPQNAREFVRGQLLSLPHRWRAVSEEQSADSETSRTAQRMIDFAGQGLDMMTEVSGVLKATLESAERWLASVGRRDTEDEPMHDAHPVPSEQWPTVKEEKA